MANDTEVRKNRIKTWVTWGLGLVGAVIISPFVFLAVKGLIGLGIATVVGFAIINLAPVVGRIFADYKLKVLKAHTEANPIERLENDYITSTQRVQEQAHLVANFDTEVRGFKSKIKKLKSDFPEDSDDFDTTLDQYQQLLQLRQDKLREASAKLTKKKHSLDLARAKWDVAMSAQSVARQAGLSADALLDQILEETAYKAVDRGFNRSLADLTTLTAQEAPSLPGKKVKLEEAGLENSVLVKKEKQS